MILTFTANPSLDLLFEAGTLLWDDANRLATPRRRPGGQGINTTRAARALGAESTAIALLGGHTGVELERELIGESTPVKAIRVAGETRVFVGVREADTGRNLLLNPRGPTLSPEEADGVYEEVCQLIDEAAPAWFAVCGSIPPGVPSTLYRDLGLHARRIGCRFIADCDGDALREAAPLCDLLVPNQHEAARLCESAINTLDDAAASARALAQRYRAVVAIKLAAQGAVLSDGERVLCAAAATNERGSAVGAGDAFLAALLHGFRRELSMEDSLADAVAAGTAVLLSRGSDLLCSADFERVRKTVRVRPHS